MAEYLLAAGRLYRVADEHDDDEASAWRIEKGIAVHERRATVEEVHAARTIRAYGTCFDCEPILVRNEHANVWGDLVNEHHLFVDVEVTIRRDEQVQLRVVAGTRDELRAELLARGLRVLREDDALAIAHRELAKARRRRPARTHGALR